MQVFKSRFGQVITLLVTLILAIALGGIWFTDGFWSFAISIPPVGLVIALIASLYWIPRVEVDQGGVRIVNVLRTHYISWNAIELIDTKYTLTLVANGKKYSAWGAPAPGRHSAIFASRDQGAHLPESTYLGGTIRPGDLISSDSGAAAAHIRRIWEQRDQDGAASINSRWHRIQILVLCVFGLATLALL